MDPIYKSIGGIKKGRSGALAWGASWPFAKLEIFMDKIVLTYLFFRKIELSKYDITSIKKYTVFSYGRGVHIEERYKIKKYEYRTGDSWCQIWKEPILRYIDKLYKVVSMGDMRSDICVKVVPYFDSIGLDETGSDMKILRKSVTILPDDRSGTTKLPEMYREESPFGR